MKNAFDVLVIGSGCGASPVAGNLADAGARVCVLERGKWWGPVNGKDRYPHGLWELMKSTRGLGVSLPLLRRYLTCNRTGGLFEYYLVMNGYIIIIPCGVGGGSLVIGGFIDKPPADYFDHFPAEITYKEMEKHYDNVARIVQPVAASVATPYATAVEKACDKIPGITAHPQLTSIWYGDSPEKNETRINSFGQSQKNCNYQSHCLTGCNRGAKNSMDITYLQRVLQNNGEIRELSEVKIIRKVSSGYEVDYYDIQNRKMRTIAAPKVVLGAGALNTMKILFASRSAKNGGLDRIGGRLGKQWGFNGDRVGIKRLRYASVDHSYGPCLFRYHELASDNHEFDFHQFACRSSVLTWLPWPFSSFGKKIIPFLSLSREKAIGTIEPSGNVIKITYPHQDGHRRADIAQRKIAYEMDCLVKDPGTKKHAINIERIDAIKMKRGIGSVHPTGGAAMAETIDKGVVDHSGEVFQYPGLFISDASILPAGTCCGPCFTIMALADRISWHIIKR